MMSDWGSSELYVINKLAEISQDLKDLKASLAVTNNEVTKLKTQSMIWGSIAGGIPVIIALVLQWFSGK